MFLGYNTNGFAHHRLVDAVALLAEIGYHGVAITIDHHALPPEAGVAGPQMAALRRLIERNQLRTVIETGARFLLDPHEKHEPTLLSPRPADRRRRIDFYKYAIDCAAMLGSDCVSIWSGRLHDALAPPQATDRLLAGLHEVLAYADTRQVDLGFEPEPGMFVDSLAGYAALCERVQHPRLRLTLDVGHLHCQGETPIAAHIRRWQREIVNVHIEDMRAGVHEHLMFGDGQIDFRPVVAALAEVGYANGLYVELSRHSHAAPQAARRAYEFLRPLLDA